MAAAESCNPEKSAVTENPETAKPTAHGSGFLSCVYIIFTDVTEGDKPVFVADVVYIVSLGRREKRQEPFTWCGGESNIVS